MYVHASTKMDVFKSVILGGDDFAKNQSNIDGFAYEK